MSDIEKTVADVAIANATDEYEKTGLDSISNYAESLLDAANYYRDLQPATQELLRLKELEREQLAKDKAELVEFVESVASASRETHEISGQYGGVDEWSFICDSYKDKAKQLLERLG